MVLQRVNRNGTVKPANGQQIRVPGAPLYLKCPVRRDIDRAQVLRSRRIPKQRPVVLAATQHEIRVFGTPRNRQDTLGMAV